MSKVKAVVVKIEDRQMQVITEDRQFLSLPAPAGAVPGKEIHVDPNKRKKSHFHYARVVAAALILLMLGTGLVNLLHPAEAVAYVSLDNPRMELGLDASNRIVEVRPLDDEARQFSERLDIHNQPITIGLKSLLQEADQAGYLSKDLDNLILLTTLANRDPESSEEIKNQVSTIMEELNLPANVGIQESSREDQSEAKERGESINDHVLKKNASKKTGIPEDVLEKMEREEIIKEAAGRGVPFESLFKQSGHVDNTPKQSDSEQNNQDEGPPGLNENGPPGQNKDTPGRPDNPGRSDKPQQDERGPHDQENTGKPDDVPGEGRGSNDHDQNENNTKDDSSDDKETSNSNNNSNNNNGNNKDNNENDNKNNNNNVNNNNKDNNNDNNNKNNREKNENNSSPGKSSDNTPPGKEKSPGPSGQNNQGRNNPGSKSPVLNPPGQGDK